MMSVEVSLLFLIFASLITSGLLWWLISVRLKTNQITKDLLNSTPDALLISDKSGNIIEANKQAEVLFGYTYDELISLTIEDLMPHRFRENHIDLRKEYYKKPSTREMAHGRELSILTKEGKEIPAEIALGYSKRGGSVKVLASIRDITERKEDEQIIYQLAYYDTLTGLPNRLHFNQQSKQVIERAREQDWRFAIFLVDLDNFKRINDTFGHHAGDELLKEIAERLQRVVTDRCEHEDNCHCFAARLGGDEFVLIIEQLFDIKQAEMIAEQIFSQFDTPIVVEDQEIHAQLSIGISLYPHDGSSISALLKSADLALYTAKDKGKNQYHFHEASMNTKVMEHFQYESALRYFIETEDFDLHYQPIIDVGDGKIVGAEALFRGNAKKYWDMNLHTMIKIAEETGMIVQLGRAILKTACIDCQKCNERGLTHNVAVNVSIRELNENDFVQNVIDIINETNMSPQNLTLEVTETFFVENYADNVKKLSKLKEHGVHISIDDFGKGYSSMSHLRHLPADKLKIDKEFFDYIEHDRKAQEIISGITIMAQTLGMIVCAEGIETDKQFKIIREIGIDQLQGFLTSPPIPVDDFVKLLED